MEWIIGDLKDFSSVCAEMVYESLTDSRRKRIDRFKRPDDRLRSLLGEYLVKKLLKSKYGIENAVIECAENGRPFLKASKLFISISHSDEIVVCAVSDRAVGIDVERLKPIKAGLIDRVCTDAEKIYVLNGAKMGTDEVTDEGIITRFYEIWTGKEAYFKAKGTGITDFKSVNVLELDRKVEILDGYLVQIV